MNFYTKKPVYFSIAAILIALLISNLTPLAMLGIKSANTDKFYSAGWKEGCESGMNSNSPIRAMLLDKPFTIQGAEATAAYKAGWNVAYTSCRFAQTSADGWIQTILIISVLLVIFCRKENSGPPPV